MNSYHHLRLDRAGIRNTSGVFVASLIGWIVYVFQKSEVDEARKNGDSVLISSLESFDRTDVLILFACIGISAIVYKLSNTASRTSREIVNDLLTTYIVSTKVSLKVYRVNIMRLDPNSGPVGTFRLVAHFGVAQIHKYRNKITTQTPGVGEAFSDQARTIILRGNHVVTTIDSWPKFIFSRRIQGTFSVLSVDTDQTNLTDDIKTVIEESIETLETTLSKYPIDQLNPLD